MHRAIVWTVTLLGTAIGVFSALMDGIGLMVVMGLIGATFGCCLGNGISLLTGIARRQEDSYPKRYGAQEYNEHIMDRSEWLEKIGKEIQDRDQFPIPGDPDPIPRIMNSSPDLTNLDRHQGF